MSDAERARSRTSGISQITAPAPVKGRAAEIFNSQAGTPDPIHVGGVPIEAFNAANTAAAAQTPEGRLTMLKNEQLRRQLAKEKVAEDANRLELLKAEQARRQNKGEDPRIDTTPQPTGIKRIDQAGQTVPFQSGSGNLPAVPIEIPSLDDLPFDHPDRIRKQRADDGVDMISGLGFEQRRAAAGAPNIPRLAKGQLTASLRELLSATPDDLPKMRWDTALNEHQVLLPTEEGKFRWTSLDGTGVELGDLADMFDLAEAGSLIGGIVGTTLGPGKVRFLNVSKARPGVGGLSGALLGRTIGDAVELVSHFNKTGEAPTYEELLQLTKDGAMTEVLASVLTEAGAAVVRTGSSVAQEAAARSRGLQAIDVEEEGLAQLNKNIRDTQDVMRKLNKGGMTYSVTPGQSTRSITLLTDEAHKLKGANADTKTAFSEAAARNDKALEEYIRRELGGDLNMLGDNMIIAAKDSLSDVERVTVAQTSNGDVHFLPKLVGAEAEVGVNGLVVRPDSKVWQVKTGQIPEDLRGLGFGTTMYKAAAEEAQARGAVLGSSDQMNANSIGLWKKFEKDGTLGELEWHPDAFDPVRGSGRLETPDGLPVVRMKEPEPITPQLLDSFMVTGRGDQGKFVANKIFREFMKKPGRLMNEVQEEITGNPYLTQQWKEAIFADYEKAVGKGTGKNKVFDEKAWNQWKDETSAVVDRIFTGEELIKIKTSPNGLREVVEGSRARVTAQRKALSKELRIDVNDKAFVDPSQRKLMAQMKSRPPASRTRAMRIMDASGAGEAFRARFREEIKEDLINRTKGKNWKGFEKWMNTDGNGEMIRDVLGQEYVNNLKTIRNVLRLKSDASMIRGAAAETNPTGLALFRVAFGPLSRTQRFLTGARRGLVRAKAATAADVMSNPAQLREFTRLRIQPLASRQVARFALDTGLAEDLGFGNMDVESEADRQALADQVMITLQGELDDNE
jgi:hypothetical protein